VSETEIKQSVRNFYDQVGWQKVADDIYQNARYEDLRPVSHEYIHKCHMRVNRYLCHQGKYILDAGSGPIQYEEYLSYSEGYQYRVCLDISLLALQEARKRIGGHGLFVVGDVAHLPFSSNVFSNAVSLHTIHHLPKSDYLKAFHELRRVLKNHASAVVVNGWDSSPLMNKAQLPMRIMERLFVKTSKNPHAESTAVNPSVQKPTGTFVNKMDADELEHLLGEDFPIHIMVWRSVSVRFLRAMIHPFLLGKFWLKILYLNEELFPHFFGKKGQYPLIVFSK